MTLIYPKMRHFSETTLYMQTPHKGWFNITPSGKLFTASTEFVFSGNLWRCDCHMLEFKEWYNSTVSKVGKAGRVLEQQMRSLFCRTPYYHRGLQINEIPQEAFTEKLRDESIFKISSPQSSFGVFWRF